MLKGYIKTSKQQKSTVNKGKVDADDEFAKWLNVKLNWLCEISTALGVVWEFNSQPSLAFHLRPFTNNRNVQADNDEDSEIDKGDESDWRRWWKEGSLYVDDQRLQGLYRECCFG